MITDRDIAIRGVAEEGARCQSSRNHEQGSENFDDQEVDEVIQKMGDIQVRRPPILNRDKRLVGILSLGDVLKIESEKQTGAALNKIKHSPTARPCAIHPPARGRVL